MDATVWQIIGVGVSLGIPLSGAFYGVLKYSVGRNIAAMDEKFETLEGQVSVIGEKVDALHQSYGREGMTRNECSACRRECSERMVAYQADILGWLRRQDDKADRLLMLMANAHNGMGGVK